MAISASAPTASAWRAYSTEARVEAPETPTMTGMRRFVCSTRISVTSRRSASVRNGPSLALTGATMPCAPQATQKSTMRRSDFDVDAVVFGERRRRDGVDAAK